MCIFSYIYIKVSFPVDGRILDIGSPGCRWDNLMPEGSPYACHNGRLMRVPPSHGLPIPGPEVPPSPDYIPGPEEPQSPPLLDFVHEPMYPEYMPREDEILLAEVATTTLAVLHFTQLQIPPGLLHITDTWDDLVGAIDEIAPTTVEGVNQRVTDLATIVEEETTSMYGIMEDAQDDRSQLRGRVNLLYRDRPVHRRLAVMIEREAKMAREAWGLSMDASDYARSDVMSLRTTVVAQSALISELQSADHRRQRVITELLASDHKRQVQLTKTLRLLKGLQTQMVEFQRQHGPAKGPAQPDAPGEAGSSS
ncbi:hypothetical protein Tco_0894806 [Tanacetum coccineum]|uniref:Uncharacterized protein n=1 Tax=Tanacetum coccineum TaxID=301880 RepID=A0ABQ5CJ15_9ASTR